MVIRPQRHLLTEDPPSPQKASMSDGPRFRKLS